MVPLHGRLVLDRRLGMTEAFGSNTPMAEVSWEAVISKMPMDPNGMRICLDRRFLRYTLSTSPLLMLCDSLLST